MDIRGYPPPEDPALDLPMPDAPPLHATFGTAGDVPFDDLMLVDGEDVGQLQAHRGEVAAAWGNGSGRKRPSPDSDKTGQLGNGQKKPCSGLGKSRLPMSNRVAPVEPAPAPRLAKPDSDRSDQVDSEKCFENDDDEEWKEGEWEIKCPCGSDEWKADGMDALECLGCDTWQHWKCYYPNERFSAKTAKKKEQFCHDCKAKKDESGEETKTDMACHCGDPDWESKGMETLQCFGCETWQHWKCYYPDEPYSEEAAEQKDHVCRVCYAKDHLMPPSPSIAAATRDEWLVPPPLVAEAGQAGSVNEQAGANQGPVEGPQGGLNGQEEVLERHEEFIWAQEWDTMAQAEPEKATMVLGMDEYRVGLEEIAGIEQPASSESARYSVLVDWYGGLGSEVDAPASPSPAPAPAPVSVPAPSMFAWRISVPAAVAAPAPRPPRRNYPAQQQIAGKKRKAVEDMGAASKKQCLVSLASRISGYGMKRKGESSWEESSPQGAFLPADLDRRRKANLVKVTCLINTHLPCIHENEKQHDRAKADHTRVQGISEADKSKQLNSGPRLHLGASGSQEKVVEAQNKPKTAANGLQMGGMSGDTPISKRLRSRSVAPVVHSDNKENQVPQVKGRPVKAMVPATPAPAPGVPAPVRRQTRAMALKAQEQVPKKMDGSPIDLRSRRK